MKPHLIYFGTNSNQYKKICSTCSREELSRIDSCILTAYRLMQDMSISTDEQLRFVITKAESMQVIDESLSPKMAIFLDQWWADGAPIDQDFQLTLFLTLIDIYPDSIFLE